LRLCDDIRNSTNNKRTVSRAKQPRQPAASAEELARLLKALAHPARVRLLQHLARQGSCYFGNLSDVTGLAASTTSQHVKILKEAGLVLGSAEEQKTCYCVDPARLDRLKNLVAAL
jgi:ArsR family transcriptional regulator, arsenate/arsenite/antimonite-responsive transcriptional repressor